MKILVTGGAGFIGSHVVDAYIQQGHQVGVLDNLSTGHKDFVNSSAQLYEADITDAAAVKQIIAQFQPEVINHHAAHIQVGHSVQDPQFDAQINIIGLLNVMEAAQQAGVKKIIMASTGGAMYGNKSVPFDESMKEEPLSPYGVSKRSGELYLHYYFEQHHIPYTVLRYSNVYGPRQNPHGESGVIAIFSEFMAQGKVPVINGDGTHTRDYVNVSDVARANVLAVTTDYVGALNIGTNTEVSTNEVFDRVAEEFGLKVEKQYGPARPGEQVRSVLSYHKAQQILSWQPTITFDEGVKQVTAWYKTRG